MITTTAIVATDYYGYISHEGIPIGFCALNKTVRTLDQSMLRHTLKKLLVKPDRTIIVMGESSWKEVQGTKLADQIPASTLICTAGTEGVTLDDRFHPYVETDTLSEARRWIYSYALDSNVDQIIVLGGKSVYKAFQDHYSDVYHACIKAGIGKRGDKQWFIPSSKTVDVLYDDNDMRLQRIIYEG